MIDVGTPVFIIHDDKYVRFGVNVWLEEDLKMLCKNTNTEFAFYLKDYKTFTRNDIVYYIIPYQEIIPNSDISLLITENGIHQASIRFPITIANTQYIAVIITNNILKYIDNEIPTSLNDNKVNEIHEKAVPQYVETTYKYYDDYFYDYYEEGKRRHKRK